MRATTSLLPGWNTLVGKLPHRALLVFLLVSLPLSALSIYVLPYFEFAIAKFIGLIIIMLAVFLFQIRSSMEHPNDRYLNSLTSYPINFVAISTLYAGAVAFSSQATVVQSFPVAFLCLSALLYTVYALVHNHTDGSLYKLLTRKGSALVQFVLMFALGMIAVWALPNPVKADLDSKMRGPVTSWQEQLSAAQAKVATVDSNAVLSRVAASALYPLASGYLTVNFYFVTDSTTTYIVSLQDWNPSTTATLTEGTPNTTSSTPDARKVEFDSMRRFLPNIKLSPREILLLTAPDANSGLLTWSVDLTLNPMSASLIPLWEVKHTTTTTNVSTVVQTYSILADTGTILGSSPPK